MIYILYQNETINLSLFYVGAGTFGITNDLGGPRLVGNYDSRLAPGLGSLLRTSKDTKGVMKPPKTRTKSRV